jgi:3-hydroxyacyl-CoA dehydrogenase/3a,7a,12a-trihydroxy-5b-cholest-24-enoyl-CoA hydratase
MSSELRFDGRVAIVTGAGNGLGRSHALLLGRRGAKVVVNDLGGTAHGEGKSATAADKVVAEIKALGSEAVANYDSVENGDKIVQTALDAFGRVDIVINNAGILRDVSFHKMTRDDWDLVYKVHVLGGFRVTHAAWPHLREKEYGRVLFTASAAGIYGNFGQANYGMAKLGLVGLANTLAAEGKKKNVLVNCIAPIAGSRLTETVMPKELVDALKPEFVSPLVAYLCHESSRETGGLFEVGGGFIGKLRWERTEGRSYRLSRPITPEAVAERWEAITDFSRTTHPTDITTSMQPIMDNLPTAKGRGGNDLIDVDEALAAKLPDTTSSYDERDLALYALAVGAAQDPTDDADLQLVYEMHGEGFKALPTFGVVPALSSMLAQAKSGAQTPGLNFGFERILHGEQYTEVKRPLPPKATLTHRSRIKDIFDKGKNALVVTEMKSYDEAGAELIVNEVTTLVRGAGGWGGDRGPQGEVNAPPDRAPDATITEKTTKNQALLYRLTGDWNPLHADPSFAAAFGFERPILHGLCTFGYAARHVIKSFSKGDPRYFKSIKVRFADSVFPGETITTEMWKESDTRIILRSKVVERDAVVISAAAVELYKEIPKEPAAPVASAPAPKAAVAPAASAVIGEPTSADIFAAIRDHLAANPALPAKIATVFQFKLTSPASAWTLDLKNDKGAVTASASASDKADCTLELSDADFLGMCTGKLDSQKLYFGGKLKISGNVMASQKLEFLKKMDPEKVKAITAKRTGGSPPATPVSGAPGAEAVATPAPAEVRAPKSPEVFGELRDRLARSPALAAEVKSVIQVNVKNPDSRWVLDLKDGPVVREGTDAKAATVVTLEEDDLLALVSGAGSVRELYMQGKLRVDGDIRPAQKLSFLSRS